MAKEGGEQVCSLLLFPHTELFHNEKDGRTGLVRDVDLRHLYLNDRQIIVESFL